MTGVDAIEFAPDLADALTRPVVGLLRDPEMTNVMVTVSGRVQVMYRGRGWELVDGLMISEMQKDSMIATLAGTLGTVNNAEKPITEGSLCGSRIRIAAFGPSVVAGGRRSLVFRVQPATAFSLEDLIERGMLTQSEASYLVRSMLDGRRIVVAGGTNSGKTTLMRALLRALLKVRPLARLVILEESSEELALESESLVGGLEGVAVLPLVSFARGNEVPLSELLRAALRANADGLVVGEIRGSEAYVLMRTLRSGHGGTVLTMHAGSAREVLSQLAVFCAEAGEHTPPEQWAAVLSLVVNVTEWNGSRKVRSIEQVELENGEINVRGMQGV